jgi:NAD(P)-dependent dehydrogenase (short-subunit alcohol dehydrogenase family)
MIDGWTSIDGCATLSRLPVTSPAHQRFGPFIAQLLRTNGTPVVGVARRASADVSGDAAKRETALRAVEAAERLGAIDLLVNCAGIGVFGPAGSYDERTIAVIIDANLIATINFCEVLFPRFKEHGGTIVNVLSTAALIGKANESVYCAAKWGARGYTESQSRRQRDEGANHRRGPGRDKEPRSGRTAAELHGSDDV